MMDNINRVYKNIEEDHDNTSSGKKWSDTMVSLSTKPELVREAVKLKAKGVSAPKISKIIGVSESAINKWYRADLAKKKAVKLKLAQCT